MIMQPSFDVLKGEVQPSIVTGPLVLAPILPHVAACHVEFGE